MSTTPRPPLLSDEAILNPDLIGMRVEAVRRVGFVLGALLQPAVWERRRIHPAPLLQARGLKSVVRRGQKPARLFALGFNR